MGRAIVRNPSGLLMDEPLSNLDARLRVQMRAEISRIQREVGSTTIYVTHDQVEAMTMGDRVAVLRKGELQQVDEPQRLFDEPANLFVASFIGSPEMNLLEGTVETSGDGLAVRLGQDVLPVPGALPALAAYAGRRVAVGIRPEFARAPADERPELLAGGRRERGERDCDAGRRGEQEAELGEPDPGVVGEREGRHRRSLACGPGYVKPKAIFATTGARLRASLPRAR